MRQALKGKSCLFGLLMQRGHTEHKLRWVNSVSILEIMVIIILIKAITIVMEVV